MVAPQVSPAVISAPPAPIVRAAAIQDSPIVLTVRTRAGTKRLVCAVDRGRTRTCSKTPSFKVSPGRHSVSVRAYDRRGRGSAARTVSVVVPDRAPPAVTVGAQPVGIAAANGTVWVSNGSAGTVSAVDASARKVVATVQVGGQLGSVVATTDSVWVSVFDGGSVVRIDPARDQVATRIDVGGRPTGLAFDSGGSLWVGNLDGYLTRIDPAMSQVTGRVTLSSGVSQPLAARGLVWIGLQSGSLVAIDPATSALAGGAVSVAQDVDALADTPAGLWVSTFSGSAALVDPAARKVVHRVTLPGRGSGIAFAGGSVWASAYDAGLVLRLDPATGALLGAIHTGLQPRESVEAGGALWVADQGAGTVTPVPLG